MCGSLESFPNILNQPVGFRLSHKVGNKKLRFQKWCFAQTSVAIAIAVATIATVTLVVAAPVEALEAGVAVAARVRREGGRQARKEGSRKQEKTTGVTSKTDTTAVPRWCRTGRTPRRKSFGAAVPRHKGRRDRSKLPQQLAKENQKYDA